MNDEYVLLQNDLEFDPEIVSDEELIDERINKIVGRPKQANMTPALFEKS